MDGVLYLALPYIRIHVDLINNQAENSFDDITGKVVADFGCGECLLDAE
jgi:2-polyprenyl-3-methyl-5-hydroxy-6-metoxy-1,4-benzoquinol methylase